LGYFGIVIKDGEMATMARERFHVASGMILLDRRRHSGFI